MERCQQYGRRSAIDCRHYLQYYQSTTTVYWTALEYAGGVVVSCSALGRSEGVTPLGGPLLDMSYRKSGGGAAPHEVDARPTPG